MNKNQGAAHITSIFALPILAIGIFYSPIWLKIILTLLFLIVSYFIWKKILK